MESANENHENFEIVQVELVLSPEFPHFGASPDAIVCCDCCGRGCVEVKCPYCARNTSLQESIPKYILKGETGMTLNQNHQYYYQMQMAICSKEYCDFVVWCKKDMYIERILFNDDFWLRESSKATTFWRNVILPELYGKYYTSPRHVSTVPDDEQPSTSTFQTITPAEVVWCVCRKKDTGRKMIRCDNTSCPVQWYHMNCLRIKKSPKIWYCDSCSHLKEKGGRKLKSKKEGP